MMQSIVMSMSACLHDLKATWPNFTQFLCMLPVAMAWSSFDGFVTRYVLPVLWMMSCFRTMQPVGRIKHNIMFGRVCQVAVAVERQTAASVWLSSSECGPGVKVCYLQLHCLYIAFFK